MNTATTTTQTAFTVRFDSVRVNSIRRHTATVYANGKKVYTRFSGDREKVKQEVDRLIQNLKTYCYAPEKPVGIKEEIWYLFRELSEAGKLPHGLRSAVLLQRHTWNESQSATMLDRLKEISNA